MSDGWTGQTKLIERIRVEDLEFWTGANDERFSIFVQAEDLAGRQALDRTKRASASESFFLPVTLHGVGAGHSPPVYLKSDDTMTISIKNIGDLENHVVAEEA